MRKEVVIAIVLGFGLGLVITFGIWTANRAIQEEPAPAPTETEEISPTPAEETPTPVPTTLELEILEPENNSISTKNEIELNGTSIPGAVVVVFYEEGEKIIQADQDGQFMTTIPLIGGANQIKVKTFDEMGNEAEETLEIIFSTAKI